MAPLSGLLLAAATVMVAACGQGQICAGQCYPSQLDVVLRSGATPAADRAAMLRCRRGARRSHSAGWLCGENQAVPLIWSSEALWQGSRGSSRSLPTCWLCGRDNNE